jgi:hypothetical protein
MKGPGVGGKQIRVKSGLAVGVRVQQNIINRSVSTLACSKLKDKKPLVLDTTSFSSLHYSFARKFAN